MGLNSDNSLYRQFKDARAGMLVAVAPGDQDQTKRRLCSLWRNGSFLAIGNAPYGFL